MISVLHCARMLVSTEVALFLIDLERTIGTNERTVFANVEFVEHKHTKNTK